ncbi:MAG: DNA repair exonuclease [Dehalococcoidia bacterium]
MTRRDITLLHTADIHVGADYYPEEAMRGLEEITRLARHYEVDAVLVAGDLFDHRRVSRDTVRDVFRSLAGLERPVVVLPGNHDTPLLNGARPAPKPAGAVVVLTQRDGQSVRLDGLGLTVWGRPVYEHVPSFRPLANPPPRPDDGWYVTMAHGLVPYEYPFEERSSVITAEELGAVDADYVALGHVHVFRDVTSGGAPAFYSGAPSGGQKNTAALVSLSALDGVRVEPVEVPGWRPSSATGAAGGEKGAHRGR